MAKKYKKSRTPTGQEIRDARLAGDFTIREVAVLVPEAGGEQGVQRIEAGKSRILSKHATVENLKAALEMK